VKKVSGWYVRRYTETVIELMGVQTTANSNLFTSYDILALQPTTFGSFQQACLTHALPSTLTCHIISLPLTLPRLPFRLKHTLIRTALKNGVLFEVNYVGALEGQSERRNWWAGTRELVRVTKGKGILVSSGSEDDASLRAPRDVGNLITLCGIGPNLAHDANTSAAKSLVLRAQTRKTYRAVLSEPTLVQPLSVSPHSTAKDAHVIDNQASQASSETQASSRNTPNPPLPAPDTRPAAVPGKRSFVDEDDGKGSSDNASSNNSKKRRKHKDKKGDTP